MAMQIVVPLELEERLRQEADRQGQTSDALALKILDQQLPPADPRTVEERRAAVIAMLEQWAEEDESLTDEELASNADLLRAIDEDRLSDRKLFEGILKDDST